MIRLWASKYACGQHREQGKVPLTSLRYRRFSGKNANTLEKVPKSDFSGMARLNALRLYRRQDLDGTFAFSQSPKLETAVLDIAAPRFQNDPLADSCEVLRLGVARRAAARH